MITFYLLCLSVFTGILTSLAFPHFEISSLIWIGLIPFLIAILYKKTSPNKAFLYGFVAGFSFFIFTLHPLTTVSWWGWKPDDPTSTSFFQKPEVFMNLAVFAVCIFPGGISWGLFAYLIRKCWQKNLYLNFIFFAALWVLVPEALRSFFGFSFTWGFMGYALYDNLYLRQLSAITGLYGLSFIIVALNFALGATLFTFLPKRVSRSFLVNQRVRKQAIFTLCIALFLIMLVYIYGFLKVRTYLKSPSSAIKVAILQDGSQGPVQIQDFSKIGLNKQYSVMINEALKNKAKLIVLPEAIWFPILQLDSAPSMQRAVLIPRSLVESSFKKTLTRTNATLVTGLGTLIDGKIYNSTTYWSGEGLVGLYHKQKLVPFSEYVPWFLTLFPQIIPNSRTQFFQQGGDSAPISQGGVAYGNFICQEVLYPQYAREASRDGAELLVTTGNDGVFSDPSLARVNYIAAIFRATENGKWIVRSMKTGYSQVIDPLGIVKKESRLDKKTLLYETVYPVKERTPYTRFGDWFLGLALLLCIGSLFIEKRLRTRR